MATTPIVRFDDLLSTRGRIGRGGPAAPTRPVVNALYEFGGGFPDPASFPYDGLVEATARMMKVEGAEALTYGDHQGYRGLRELVCRKYELFEGLRVTPENLIISNGSGHALSLAFSAFLDVGDAMLSEAPTFSGTLNTIRRHGPQVLDVPVDADGMVTAVAREHLARLRRDGRRCKLIYTIVNFQNPAGPTLSLERRHELIGLARGVRHADPRGRCVRRAAVRGQAAPLALRARPDARDPGRHGVEDPRRRLPSRLALRRSGDDPGLPELPLRRRRESVRVPRRHLLSFVTTWRSTSPFSSTSTARSGTPC